MSASLPEPLNKKHSMMAWVIPTRKDVVPTRRRQGRVKMQPGRYPPISLRPAFAGDHAIGAHFFMWNPLLA